MHFHNVPAGHERARVHLLVKDVNSRRAILIAEIFYVTCYQYQKVQRKDSGLQLCSVLEFKQAGCCLPHLCFDGSIKATVSNKFPITREQTDS